MGQTGALEPPEAPSYSSQGRGHIGQAGDVIEPQKLQVQVIHQCKGHPWDMQDMRQSPKYFCLIGKMAQVTNGLCRRCQGAP